jgi:hypothetical protein
MVYDVRLPPGERPKRRFSTVALLTSAAVTLRSLPDVTLTGGDVFSGCFVGAELN